MNALDRKLRSFGLDPAWVREEIRRGRAEAVMEALDRAEEDLTLRRMELEDLREDLRHQAEGVLQAVLSGELSDDDLEMLHAAGNPSANRAFS